MSVQACTGIVRGRRVSVQARTGIMQGGLESVPRGQSIAPAGVVFALVSWQSYTPQIIK